jgi:hypothetical protein
MKAVITALIITLICSPLFAQSTANDVKVVKSKDGSGTLVLPDGTKFQTSLYNLKLLGQLKTDRKLPYYILAAVGCDQCDANISIYIHSPSDGPIKDEATQRRFQYPGQELYYADHSLLYKGRMFFGNCIARYPNSAIWFETLLGSDKRWNPDVYVAAVKSDNLAVEKITQNMPLISEAEASVKKGQCREVPGKKRLSEP